MKKKIRRPKDFGRGIGPALCGLSGDSIYDFVIDFSKELGKKEEIVRDAKEYLCEKYHLEKSTVDEIFNHAVDAFSKIMLTVGFTLGQMLDIENPEAVREMNYILDKMKERDVFLAYPKHKKAA